MTAMSPAARSVAVVTTRATTTDRPAPSSTFAAGAWKRATLAGDGADRIGQGSREGQDLERRLRGLRRDRVGEGHQGPDRARLRGHGLEVEEQCPRVLVAVGGHALEAPGDDAAYGRGDVGRRDLERRGILGRDLDEELPHGVPLEGKAPRERLVHQHPERPDVRAGVDLAGAFDLLGRHVRGRPERDARRRHARRALHGDVRDAEVEQLGDHRPAGVRQEDVLGLDVAMHDASPVGVSDGLDDRHQDPGGGVEGEPLAAARSEVGTEVLALEELLDEEGNAGRVFSYVEDVDDVGVPHDVGRARLAQEPSDDVAVGEVLGLEDLDGHVAAEIRVARLPDFAHASSPQAGIECVFAPQHVPDAAMILKPTPAPAVNVAVAVAVNDHVDDHDHVNEGDSVARQYVVVTKSVFGCAGQRRPRTLRSMHAAIPPFGGFVATVTPMGTPIFTATRTVTFMSSGVPQLTTNDEWASGAESCALVRSGPPPPPWSPMLISWLALFRTAS